MNDIKSIKKELKEIAASMLSEQAKLSDENAMYSALLNMGYFYGVDAETNIILYVNDNLKKLLKKDPVGKVCHEELQNLCDTCNFCTNKELDIEHGEVLNWIHFNEKLMAIFNVYDLMTTLKTNGRKTKIRFEQSFIITKEIKDQIDKAWNKMETVRKSLSDSQMH